ncbi:MAG: YeeE/YedE family protein [Methylobacteriaceae bacterium]|nr:YeeE/YedE family protein [Methylobacteriaceae bacterium]
MLEEWVARFGDGWVSFAGGMALGGLFGAVAQRSRFCLRAATIDFWRGDLTARVAVWALAFSAAVVATQLLVAAGVVELPAIRQLNQRGSLSGAIIGGAMFGVGMVLTRGCASRLLVLSANGNLRALLSGLIFAVAAQAASRGLLAPARDSLAALWTIDGADRLNLLTLAGAPAGLALPLALIFLATAIAIARRVRIGWRQATWAAGVGLMVAATWAFTAQLASASFDPQPVKSLSFTGPSANMLMLVLQPGGRFDFDIGLVPGVFLGSFLAAAAARELRLEGFHGGESMRRYIVGALLMGFGGMLAAGCAIGAGVSGAAVFSTVSWATLLAMWAAAGLADAALDRPGLAAAPQAEPAR